MLKAPSLQDSYTTNKQDYLQSVAIITAVEEDVDTVTLTLILQYIFNLSVFINILDLAKNK